MKTLYLLRHAKAETKEGSKPDFERVLADKGRKQSLAMGKVMKSNQLVPDCVLCSPANRTKETLEGVRKILELDSDILQWERIIYEGGAKDLLKLLADTSNKCTTVLLVGHNFAISDFYNKLTVENGMMSTADLAKINFDVTEWEAVSFGSGQLHSYYSSKDYLQD